MQKAAEIPLSIDRGHIAAAATIDGQPVTMWIDTGAQRTVVTPEAVEALRLARDPHAISHVRGTGGETTSHNARLQSFGIGGMEMLDQSYAVAPLASATMLGDAASGALGEDWLSDYAVELDLPHRRMALYSVQDCAAAAAPWPMALAPLRLNRFTDGLLLVPVTLNSARLSAILDSGSDRSAVTEAAAARAGVDPTALSGDPGGISTGSDGTVRRVHLHRFTSLDVGPDHVAEPRLSVDPLHLTDGAEMLLGLDWMAHHRLWIDESAPSLTIQPGSTNLDR